jgi:lauroyl/myristoyl acyltransferase
LVKAGEHGSNVKVTARQAKREAILAALAKSTGEAMLPADMEEGENGNYYTLAREQIEALLNGDMQKIEQWVSSLDRRHATWLLRWLIKEGS